MTTSPQQKIYNLKRALADLGISESTDWFGEENTYTISGEEGALLFSVRLPVPDYELPEDLKRFGWNDGEVERYIFKNSPEHRTIPGARFEVALNSYMNSRFHELPEIQAMEAKVEGFKSSEDFRAYDAERTRIWQDFIANDPRIRELQAELDTLY